MSDRLIEVSRISSTKRYAKMIAGWMRRVEMKRVMMSGNRGHWVAMASATALQLAKFASIEANYDVKIAYREMEAETIP